MNACENVIKTFLKTTVKIKLLRHNILMNIFESFFLLSSIFKFCRLMTFNLELIFGVGSLITSTLSWLLLSLEVQILCAVVK